MEHCMYDSRQAHCKTPFGAVAAKTEVCFHLYLPKSLPAQAVRIVFTAEDEKDILVSMRLTEVGKASNIYAACFTPPNPRLFFYYFMFEENGTTYFIKSNSQGIGVVGDEYASPWQLTVYDEKMTTPACFGNGIIYQVFPDRFCNSGTVKENIPAGRALREDWGGMPYYLPNSEGEITNSDYFGGDLRGIEEKLPYIQSLGATCIYLNPIFEAHSSHRYNTADYSKVDPLLGTEADFKSLCASAKECGISVILDGVFSHTGSDSIYFNREGRYGERSGAARNPNSPCRSWYNFKKYPSDYESWWGFITLPNVTETDPSYLNFICNEETGVLQKWLRLGAGGFRLDVADELPDAFIDRLRQTVKAVDPEKCVIGEVWEDASNKVAYGKRRRYLLGGQLDSVMNYPFRQAILSYIRSGNSGGFLSAVIGILENYPPPVLSCLMNSLSTHDTPRAITQLVAEAADGRPRLWQAHHHYLSVGDYERGQILLKLSSVLQYFMPGIPCLYYGDEAGMSGHADPFNRCCYPWEDANQELVAWFARLGQLRLSLGFLRESDFAPVTVTSDICSYLRKGDGGKIFVAVNRCDYDVYLPIPSGLEDEERLILCGSMGEDNILCARSAVVIVVRA